MFFFFRTIAKFSIWYDKLMNNPNIVFPLYSLSLFCIDTCVRQICLVVSRELQRKLCYIRVVGYGKPFNSSDGHNGHRSDLRNIKEQLYFGLSFACQIKSKNLRGFRKKKYHFEVLSIWKTCLNRPIIFFYCYGLPEVPDQ